MQYYADNQLENCTQKRLPRRLVVRCPISQKLGYTR